MRKELPSPQDQYLEQLFASENSLMKQSRIFAEELGLARISLSPHEGRLLAFVLRLHGVRKCVEIGTLTGLSAQYIFASLGENGVLWTFEKSPQHAAKAAQIFAQMSDAKKSIHLHVGDAKEKLQEIEKDGPFDAVFIDGNKAAYGDYLEWAERNLRRGGLIIADNVFLSGAVWGASPAQKFNEKQIRVLQNFNQRLADESLYESALVPTSEGLFLGIKKF